MSDTDPDPEAEADAESGATEAADFDAPGDLDPEAVQADIAGLREAVHRRIVGQHDAVEALLVCLLCDGNALLESVPGLGKTTLVRTVADATDLSYSRIQNTPDLMPSDITGTEIIREGEGQREFVFEQGPVFANVVLADEINRATPKTQAALLEAMQEKQVTAAGETYRLPSPFFLLATQNPIEQEGTYPLPEAQTDRFMLKVVMDYPSRDEEIDIVERYASRATEIPVDRVLDRERLLAAQDLVRQVPIADDVRDAAIDLVRATRETETLDLGASPRASMALVRAAKARAFLEERAYVRREDVEATAVPVLQHRIALDFRAEREGLTPADVVADLL